MPALFPPAYPDRPDAPLLAFGPSFSEEIARSVIATLWHDEDAEPHNGDIRDAAALTMLEAFHPRDHLECMLAAQGVAAHMAVLECLRRAMLPDTAELLGIKLRANAVQLQRMFSNIMHDTLRLQSKPVAERPQPGGPDAPPAAQDEVPPLKRTRAKAVPPVAAVPAAGATAQVGLTPASTEPQPGTPHPIGPQQDTPGERPSTLTSPEPGMPDLDDVAEMPEDVAIRPDGSPGSLTGYLTTPPEVPYVPSEPPLMMALRTRPSPYRMVNSPEGAAPAAAADCVETTSPPPVDWMDRGPLDLMEPMFTGDALSRFASARLDPDAPRVPMTFEDDTSIVELEMISTGGDPDAEAERAAMIAAHPEGKPIVTFRHGSGPVKPPADETA